MSIVALSVLMALAPKSRPVRVAVDSHRPTIPVSRSLYGIFFEEINHGGEGGIYGELLENRGFEQPPQKAGLPLGWTGTGQFDAQVRLNETRNGSIRLGARQSVSNTGFWGVPVQASKRYRLVLWTRGTGRLSIALQAGAKSSPSQEVEAGGDRWRRHELTLRPGFTASQARLALAQTGSGEAWIGFASLFPEDTWKGRPNGLRRDLAEKVAGMKPAFVRFPGGCFIEADTLAQRWRWKDTIGPVETRRGLPWTMWGYPSSHGLGYHEYLQWCEDLGAEALFVASVGMAHRDHAPMSEMDAYVQEALDAVEYARGPVTSKWGAVRARNGHPKPFDLKYVEIGNENGGPLYRERYALIAAALRERYPDIKLVVNLWGGYPKDLPHDLLDEHYYNSPDWFWANADRYDAYDRKGPQIYVGEYAVTKGCGKGNLAAALGEAAFMVGMERNSDIVKMASYAPLFVNDNNRAWNPDAIVFNGTQSYGTPSYWVQRLFAEHRPDVNLATTIAATPKPFSFRGGFGLQTWRTKAEFKEVRIEADGKVLYAGMPNAAQWTPKGGDWSFGPNGATQGDLEQDRRLMLGGVAMNDVRKFTFRAKARKIAGEEGFILMFGVDGGNYYMWNVGGWGNTRDAFERGIDEARGEISPSPSNRIETGRWYDIRVEGDGTRVRGYVDDRLMTEVENLQPKDFTALAGLDEKRNEVVIKAVNGADEPREMTLDLKGDFQPTGRIIEMTSASLADENTFAEPRKIAPRERRLQGVKPGMRVTLTPRSVTILRLKRRPR